MAKNNLEQLSPPNLTISKIDAKNKINERIAIGNKLYSLKINSESEYDILNTDFTKWTNFNTELLTRIFENKYYVDKYDWSVGMIMGKLNSSLNDKVENLKTKIKRKNAYLEGFLETIDLIPSNFSVNKQINAENIQGGFNQISEDFLEKDPEIETIFVDIVGYSKKPHNERLEIIEKLNEIVLFSIRENSLNNKFLLLPTGDGVAISVLTEDALATINIASKLRAKLRTAEIPIRIGVNKSRDTIVKDVNNRINISGPGIIGAQRIMDFAKNYKLNISESVFLSIKDRKDESLFGDRMEELDKHKNSWIFYEYEG